MMIRTNRVLGWLAVSLIALASPAFADHHEKSGKSAKAEPSPEARAEMADSHQKMAECLRSTRPMKECRAEMKKSCDGMHGEGGCSMGTQKQGAGHAHGANDAAKGKDAAAETK